VMIVNCCTCYMRQHLFIVTLSYKPDRQVIMLAGLCRCIAFWLFSDEFVLLTVPESNTRKLAGAGCKSRQVLSRMSRSSSSSKCSGSGRVVIQCTVCSKTFNNSSALAKHKLIHSEERRYTCSQCSKSFKRQDHL